MLLSSLLRGRASRRVRPARLSAPSPAASRPAAFEALEARRLLAADPGGTAVLAGDQLQVTGTRKADQIVVDLNGTTSQLDVTINGTAAGSFDPAVVAGIRVDAGGGNDVVTIGAGVTDVAFLRGGKGNDTLTGGAGNDQVLGETGRDTCDGGGGDDSVHGGPGNDSLTGGGGNDDVGGEAGRDSVRGGDGADDLDGGPGNDDADGEAGDDRVLGGSGRDRVRGALGDDDADGGSGNDDVGGDDGNDRVRGGPGRDVCDGGTGDDDLDGNSGRDRIRGGGGQDSFDDAFDDDRDRDNEFEDRGPGDGEHIPVDQLPAAVKTEFDARFPGVTIRQVERETEDAGIVYKIDFVNAQAQRVRAEFTEAGQFISQEARDSSVVVGNGDDDNNSGGDDGQTIPLDQVPAAVRTAFDTQFPSATVREVETEVEHGTRVYKIDFLNTQGERWRVRYTEAGQAFRLERRDGGDDNGSGSGGGGDDSGGGSGGGGDDSGGGNNGQQIAYADLPQAVRTAFEGRYPGANVGEVERENEDAGVVFKIDFTREGRRVRAEFSEAGQFLRDEVRD